MSSTWVSVGCMGVVVEVVVNVGAPIWSGAELAMRARVGWLSEWLLSRSITAFGLGAGIKKETTFVSSVRTQGTGPLASFAELCRVTVSPACTVPDLKNASWEVFWILFGSPYHKGWASANQVNVRPLQGLMREVCVLW